MRGRHVVFGWGFLERGRDGWDGGGIPVGLCSTKRWMFLQSLRASAPGACLGLFVDDPSLWSVRRATCPSRRPCSILRAVGWESSDWVQFALLEAVREVREGGLSFQCVCACARGGRDGILRPHHQGFGPMCCGLLLACCGGLNPKSESRDPGMGIGRRNEGKIASYLARSLRA